MNFEGINNLIMFSLNESMFQNKFKHPSSTPLKVEHRFHEKTLVWLFYWKNSAYILVQVLFKPVLSQDTRLKIVSGNWQVL